MKDKRGYLIFLIPPHGSIDVKQQPKQPTLHEMQGWVGGSIQEVPYFTKLTVDGILYRRGQAYANEEGFIKGLEPNPRAHEFWKRSCPEGDPKRMHVCGTIIYVVKEPKTNVTES